MKQIATLTLLAAASAAASAQTSSVTLFGILDASVRNVKNGDQNITSLSSNGLQSSRIGVRGVEDLGGGLQAGFWLESAVNPDNGTADTTRFWGRRSTVSLISSSLGEIRLGRDYTPTYNSYADYDVFGTNGVANANNFLSALGSGATTGIRADNQVSYFTPANLGGFYAQATAAAGEGVAGNKYYGGRIGYRAGPLDVSGAYGETTVTPNAAGEDKLTVADIGASYDFGVAKISGYYSRTEFDNLELGVINVGAQVPVGPGRVRVSYIRADASGSAPGGPSTEANDANQIAAGYVYDLSKRTAIYATAARIKNKGTAGFVIAGGPALPAGGKSTGYELGLRHSF
jgi:predicted porin